MSPPALTTVPARTWPSGSREASGEEYAASAAPPFPLALTKTATRSAGDPEPRRREPVSDIRVNVCRRLLELGLLHGMPAPQVGT
jgi:hypothetical protein